MNTATKEVNMPTEWLDIAKGNPLPPPLRKHLPSFMGCIYAAEVGRVIKVGTTLNPADSRRSLLSLRKNYADIDAGEILLSKPHTNYMENKAVLLRKFQQYRTTKGSSLLTMSMAMLVKNMPDLVFEDETERLKAESKASCDFFVKLLWGEQGLQSRS